MSEGGQCIFVNRHISPDGEIFFDTNEFCNAILSLAGDDKMAGILAANAYKSLLNKNTASGMAREMNSLYKTLIRSKKMYLESLVSG